jgi:hypothetical protein
LGCEQSSAAGASSGASKQGGSPEDPHLPPSLPQWAGADGPEAGSPARNSGVEE